MARQARHSPRKPPDWITAINDKALDDEVNEAAAVAPRSPGKKPPRKPPLQPVAEEVDDTAEEVAEAPVVIVPSRKTLSLGSNVSKPTKKEVELRKAWSRNPRKAMDAHWAAVGAAAHREFKHSKVYVGAETKEFLVGIPCPLPIEFLLKQDCLVLGVVYHLVAPWYTSKSALVSEFIRWAAMAGGGGEIKENESKFSPELAESILRDYFNRMIMTKCDSIESWQRALTYGINSQKKFMVGTKKDPGPGRTFPVVFAVDSILGKLSQKSQDDIAEAGAAGGGYPIEARDISRYLKTMPQWLEGWPFLVLLVNHLKFKKDDAGNEVRHTPGGSQVNFQESFEIELKRWTGRGKMIHCAEFDGQHIEMRCEKNSFGGSQHHRILTRLLWWAEDEGDGTWQQRTVWDWDWSTVHLLNKILNGKEEAKQYIYYRRRLVEAGFHLVVLSAGDIENAAWSKTLKVTEKHPLPWSTPQDPLADSIGARIRNSPEVLTVLRNALCIHQRPLLQGDYLQQFEDIKKGAR